MRSDLLTLAERTDFQQTGRTDEVDRLCAAMQAEWPDAVRSLEFGRSAEGRPMRALIVSRTGALDPRELQERRVPVLMLQAGIHPGESDGKDAGFIALRELLSANTRADPLERQAVLFVPAFNTDGHERVGPWNRPNQNGPQITGWRATAQNLNLNRDYAKADAPEMRALLVLVTSFDPLICADLHVTDGADFEPDISLQVEPINQGDPKLHASARELRGRLIERLARQGSLPLAFYPDFAETDNPASGFVLSVYSPRFSTGYFPQRNRFTVLVETHSWKPYARRVQITVNTIMGLAELTAERGGAWLAEVRAADGAACALGGSKLILDYRSSWREPTAAGKESAAASGEADTRGEADADAERIDFRGYAYTREPSDISGAQVTVYDPGTPQIWRVPYRSRIEPTLAAQAPRQGYIVPRAYADEIVPRLKCHGITVEPAPSSLEQLEQFRARRVAFSSQPFEGRMRATLSGAWETLHREIAARPLFVPIAQPLARLIVALLEPEAPDSFAAWGFFNACFEQKEHLEPYVAEQIARSVLAADPKLRHAFDARLAQDAAFRADPVARLEFFCRHHPSWDERLNCYPIYRV
ncbi:MAG: M14 family zinc carboxypeptidase [Steroidobacteraceae bacterium]|jgi:murein tripeptide amidase MpaA